MARWRKVIIGSGMGFAVGISLVFLVNSKAREKLQEEFHNQWENLRLKVKEYQTRLEKAIEEGKAASRLKQQELEKEMSIKRIEDESPDYIV